MLIREAGWLIRQGRAPMAKKVIFEVLRTEPGNLDANWLMKRIE